ncbi:hypothetical protein HPB47_020497 [Ixodes persulcatus]|uniref:Uncharacterized protein n=1 Tax=Ixodes persulcatus TaxID=34615 RepID=A0AC60QF80_IXOPE|nr:hypothetical protein HPB47_020497 [Ixodes persulcatus]
MQGHRRQHLCRLRRRRQALGPGVSVAKITVTGREWSGRRRRLCPGLEIDVDTVVGIVVAAPYQIGSWGADAACLPHLQQLWLGSLWPPGPPRTAPSPLGSTSPESLGGTRDDWSRGRHSTASPGLSGAARSARWTPERAVPASHLGQGTSFAASVVDCGPPANGHYRSLFHRSRANGRDGDIIGPRRADDSAEHPDAIRCFGARLARGPLFAAAALAAAGLQGVAASAPATVPPGPPTPPIKEQAGPSGLQDLIDVDIDLDLL